MFRGTRSRLVKRLWKHRIYKNEAESTIEKQEDMELRSVAHSLLKRLKEKNLDTLIEAVESQGGVKTECVHIPKGDVRFGRKTVTPQLLCCQIWRWPDVSNPDELKKMPECVSQEDATTICCNPFHWSRIIVPDMPPPPYCQAVEDTEKDPEPPDRLQEEPCSTETGNTPLTRQRYYSGEHIRNEGATERSHWCHVAYWELRQRVGRLYTVFDHHLDIFHSLPQGNGMCLKSLLPETSIEQVKRTREKISFGVTLSKEGDGVWVYNRSTYPVFVNSPTLDDPDSRLSTIRKVPQGFSIKIFDYEQSEILRLTRKPGIDEGPYDPHAIRLSFAKGWGAKYSRQFITSCPCWIEILLTEEDGR
ncbi:unnamed protein product [Owenia fusiformis]|uniref:Mothers against decapentaplegic homolog n=1 Tax=Owenia fusiformis TaxID=6347 RepID=A0A8S4P8D4_OWEFU|nr:unnamed protein product [Owenia fusiformis]